MLLSICKKLGRPQPAGPLPRIKDSDMIQCKYCKVKGKLIGYVFFNDKHIFSNGLYPASLKQNMHANIYIHNKDNLKWSDIKVEFEEVGRDEIPFEHMRRATYTRFFGDKAPSVDTLPSEKLPSFTPSKDELPKDDTYEHMVKDGVLYVYKVVAKYKLAQ